MTPINNKLVNTKLDQESADSIAIALSTLFGAKVVSKSEFDKINHEKQKLLKHTEDIQALRVQLIRTECKLRLFVQYHKKWKHTTKSFEQKLVKLNKEKLLIDFQKYPDSISENLSEAYKCYTNGLYIACYMMTLRTIELIATLIYDEHNPPRIDENEKNNFIPASKKLNWVKKVGMIGGADYILAKSFIEARNDVIHEVFVPSELQILSAFETVIKLTNKLNLSIGSENKV
jgi:hypothetical protein